jgi:hypothetical protein
MSISDLNKVVSRIFKLSINDNKYMQFIEKQ